MTPPVYGKIVWHNRWYYNIIIVMHCETPHTTLGETTRLLELIHVSGYFLFFFGITSQYTHWRFFVGCFFFFFVRESVLFAAAQKLRAKTHISIRRGQRRRARETNRWKFRLPQIAYTLATTGVRLRPCASENQKKKTVLCNVFTLCVCKEENELRLVRIAFE